MTIWGYRIQWFDVFTVICGIICSAMYSWYIGNWLKGMSIGPLMFILGWMTMEWFILGDDDYSISTDQGPGFHRAAAANDTPNGKERRTRRSIGSNVIAMDPANQTLEPSNHAPS
jgi:hypothetical protein